MHDIDIYIERERERERELTSPSIPTEVKKCGIQTNVQQLLLVILRAICRTGITDVWTNGSSLRLALHVSIIDNIYILISCPTWQSY